jgi:hypothetical protein
VLAELDEALSCQYGITNANIHEGKNPYIKFKNTGFSLSTPTQEESEAEPLQQFFPERDYLPLLEILATVNRDSHWMDELQHWQRHHHGRPALPIGSPIHSRTHLLRQTRRSAGLQKRPCKALHVPVGHKQTDRVGQFLLKGRRNRFSMHAAWQQYVVVK